jgi:type IV pilus assembly protein PilX
MRTSNIQFATGKRQQGAALFMSLIFLLILTILGVFGMGTSRLENLMAGNYQFQTASLSDAEVVISAAREYLTTTSPVPNPATAGNCLNLPLNDTVDNVPQLPKTWTGADTCTYTPASGDAADYRYAIEYLGDGVYPPDLTCSSGMGTGAAAPCPIKVYRITATNDGQRGAKRTVQTYYEMTRGPGDI